MNLSAPSPSRIVREQSVTRRSHRPESLSLTPIDASVRDASDALSLRGSGAALPHLHLASASRSSGRPPVRDVMIQAAVGAAWGALGTFTGGVLGAVVGGLTGLGFGGRAGFSLGEALSLNLARKTGEGQVNPVVGGIGSVALPFVGGTVGAVAGATAGVLCAITGQPLLGAALGGGCALVTAMTNRSSESKQ